MANVKKDTLSLSNGKQIQIPGGVVSISKTLELSDYYSRKILFFDPASKNDNKISPVQNIYGLSADEWIEMLDNMIRLMIDLKDNIRKYGIQNPEIFNLKKGDF